MTNSVEYSFKWKGRAHDPSKLHSDALEAFGEGVVTAGSWLLEQIEGNGAPGRIPPVYWPYLTGFSRNSFYLDNQEEHGVEVDWELHNSADAPVGSKKYYAVYVEHQHDDRPIQRFAERNMGKMQNIIKKHVDDWTD